MTLFLDENDIAGLLDMPSVIDAVESVLHAGAEGLATNHARRRAALPTGSLNVMFAGSPGLGAYALKTYTISKNGASFLVMFFDAENGKLLSLMQADRLGAMRTGAASAVATKYLAREDATTLGMYGAGGQAETQLEAIAAVRKLERVIVHSRTEESRKAFAEKMSERIGLEVETTHSPEEPAAQDIVVTVTSAREPVLHGEWLKEGAHVNAAGVNMLSKAEIDREVVKRAASVYIDSREEIGLEAGNLQAALDTGALLPEAVRELGGVIAGQVPGRRSPEDITLFASQGIALEDLATARLAYDRAKERGVGRELEL
jgi:ornithine cyclodeaminase/alanine dehydrogenase